MCPFPLSYALPRNNGGIAFRLFAVSSRELNEVPSEPGNFEDIDRHIIEIRTALPTHILYFLVVNQAQVQTIIRVWLVQERPALSHFMPEMFRGFNLVLPTSWNRNGLYPVRGPSFLQSALDCLLIFWQCPFLTFHSAVAGRYGIFTIVVDSMLINVRPSSSGRPVNCWPTLSSDMPRCRSYRYLPAQSFGPCFSIPLSVRDDMIWARQSPDSHIIASCHGIFLSQISFPSHGHHCIIIKFCQSDAPSLKPIGGFQWHVVSQAKIWIMIWSHLSNRRLAWSPEICSHCIGSTYFRRLPPKANNCHLWRPTFRMVYRCKCKL